MFSFWFLSHVTVDNTDVNFFFYCISAPNSNKFGHNNHIGQKKGSVTIWEKKVTFVTDLHKSKILTAHV